MTAMRPCRRTVVSLVVMMAASVLHASAGRGTGQATGRRGDAPLPDTAITQEVAEGIRLLRSKDSDDRVRGAKALTQVGPAASPALPYLLPLLDDQPDDVCVATIEPSGRAGEESRRDDGCYG